MCSWMNVKSIKGKQPERMIKDERGSWMRSSGMS